MRVIKSGVEMTPEQLTRVKGGACACGCNYDSAGTHSASDSHGGCFCDCKGIGGLNLHSLGGIDAASYL